MFSAPPFSSKTTLVAGAVFLLSGFAKALDAGLFAHTIGQYGLGDIGDVAAPLIILVELLLGLALVLQYRSRWTARAGVAFVAGLTAAFLYGWLVQGVEDCGCFGRLEALNTSPALTLVRNAALLYLLVAVGRHGNNRSSLGEPVTAVVVGVMCIGAFMSGYTGRGSLDFRSDDDNHPQALADTPLASLVQTHADSTYLVFAFSYTCPHCLNSVEHLNRYESAGVVDRVIGLAAENPEAEARFRAFFQPRFPIRHCPPEVLHTLTRSFPTAYYIRHDSVVSILPGTLPSAYLLGGALEHK